MPETEEFYYLSNKKYPERGFVGACKKCSSELAKLRTAKHREELLPYWRNYYFENKPRKREINQNWMENNKEERREYQAEYRKTEAFINSTKKSQQFRKMHKKHILDKVEWQSCKEYFNMTCAYCGLPIEDHYRIYAGKPEKIDFHKEHFINDGLNDLSNCLPSCMTCNNAKKTMDFEEWYTENNKVYSAERLAKLRKWLQEDYKQYIRNFDTDEELIEG